MQDIRDEVLSILDSQPRYVQNTKKDSMKWHKLFKEYGQETPALLRAKCGWRCGRSYTAEVSRTLGQGSRCDKCFPEAEDPDA